MLELGLTMEEIMAVIDEAGLDDILVQEPDLEMMEALEEFEMPEPEEEEEEEAIVREIPVSESTGEFEELDVEAYTDMEAAAEEALSLMLEEVRKIKENEGVKVPLTKDDWIEKLPSTVKSMFFEEELKELDIPDIEQLAKLAPEEVEELLGSISDAKKTDNIDVESSYAEIVGALKVKFDEIEEEEELDEGAQKKRIIRILPSVLVDYFSEGWLENLSIDELNELTQLSESEIATVVETLSGAREQVKTEPIDEIETEEIDFEEELERLDLVEDLPGPSDEEDIDSDGSEDDESGIVEELDEPASEDAEESHTEEVDADTVSEPSVEDVEEEPVDTEASEPEELSLEDEIEKSITEEDFDDASEEVTDDVLPDFDEDEFNAE
jgi:hypothetical protein